MFEVPIINGDLFKCQMDLIVQQCNCLTVTAHGLSDDIRIRLRVDPYSHRQRLSGRRNCAILSDRDQVGSVKIYKRSKGNPTYVACLFAQFAPGRSNQYYQDILSEQVDLVTNQPIVDDAKQCQDWFRRGLERLGQRAIQLNVKTMAFPFRIGCGLAGGDWIVYKQMIDTWAETYQNSFQVSILCNH